MKATKTLMVAALAAAGLAMTGMAQAQAKHGYRGGGGYYHGGGYYRGGGRYWGPGWGFALGVPLGIGLGWGYPYYGYYGPRVVYREVVEQDPAYIGRIHPMPAPAGNEVQPQMQPEPRMEGAPSTGPLYMNYCESSRAYYPKVTSCPEGWRFQQPN